MYEDVVALSVMVVFCKNYAWRKTGDEEIVVEMISDLKHGMVKEIEPCAKTLLFDYGVSMGTAICEMD